NWIIPGSFALKCEAQDDKIAWLRFETMAQSDRLFHEPNKRTCHSEPHTSGRRTPAFRSKPRCAPPKLWFAALTNNWIIPGSFALKCAAQDDKIAWLRFESMAHRDRLFHGPHKRTCHSEPRTSGRRTPAFRSKPRCAPPKLWFAALTNNGIIPGSFALKCAAQDDKIAWFRFKTNDPPRPIVSRTPQTHLSF